MTYKLDKKFIRRCKLNIIAMGLVFIVAGGWFAYAMALEESWKFLLGILFIYPGVKKFKELKYWKANSNKKSLEISQDAISISDMTETRSLKVSSITKAVIQPVHGKIKSIVIHSSDGGITKLKGFEAMDKIASQLKDVLGDSNVKTAKIFHR